MKDDLALPGNCKVIPAHKTEDQDGGAGATLTLDHDGCVTCSDAGIPVRIISIEGDDALCEDAAGNRAEIAVELVSPVQTGEILLTHGGVAIGKVGAENLTPEAWANRGGDHEIR